MSNLSEQSAGQRLQTAINANNHTSIRSLIQNDKIDVNTRMHGMGWNGMTALFYATLHNKPIVVDILLELGADPTLVHQGATPLFIAGYYCHLACLKIFAKHGVDLNMKGPGIHNTAIDGVAMYHPSPIARQKETFIFLLQHVSTNDELVSLLSRYPQYSADIRSEGRRRAKLREAKKIMENQTRTQRQAELKYPADVLGHIGKFMNKRYH